MTTTVKGSNSNKIPFFCPHCQRVCGTIDEDTLREFGFCKTCYVLYVEDRKEPAIDLEAYKPRRLD